MDKRVSSVMISERMTVVSNVLHCSLIPCI